MAKTDSPVWAAASKWFRSRRNRALSKLISELGSPRVLDVGGMPSFWSTVPSAAHASTIEVLNSGAGEQSSLDELAMQPTLPNMSVRRGDALALDYEDGAFDLVVCNSVLEHVGPWQNVENAAAELFRVASHGWVQVPAHEFPLEVHYMRPFVHWLSEPAQGAIMRLTNKAWRDLDPGEVRATLGYVRLLTGREMQHIFPAADVRSERLLGLTKSHIAVW